MYFQSIEKNPRELESRYKILGNETGSVVRMAVG